MPSTELKIIIIIPNDIETEEKGKKENKKTGEDAQKERKLHDTKKKKMCSTNNNSPFCRSSQLS
jgi:hypothetical protein